MKFGIVAVIIFAFLGLVVGGMYVSYNNQEVGLRNEASAQQDKCMLVQDTMWKTLKQKAGVSEQSANKFKEVFSEIMDARYDNARGGALLSFITEANPNYDQSLYADLSRSVESERKSYMTAQSRLRDIKREHDDLRQKMPGNFFVGDRPELKITLVTSTVTEGVYEQGVDDDTNLFNNM